MLSNIVALLFFTGVIGIIIVLCRLWPWLTLLFLSVNSYIAYIMISDFYETLIHASLIIEYGDIITVYYWAVALLLTISPMVGLLLGIRRQRRQKGRKRMYDKAVSGV